MFDYDGNKTFMKLFCQFVFSLECIIIKYKNIDSQIPSIANIFSNLQTLRFSKIIGVCEARPFCSSQHSIFVTGSILCDLLVSSLCFPSPFRALIYSQLYEIYLIYVHYSLVNSKRPIENYCHLEKTHNPQRITSVPALAYQCGDLTTETVIRDAWGASRTRDCLRYCNVRTIVLEFLDSQ